MLRINKTALEIQLFMFSALTICWWTYQLVSESCPKLSHDNRILKSWTKIVSLEGVVKKWLKCRTKGILCSRAPEKGVEPVWELHKPQGKLSVLCSRGGLLGVSPTLANLGNDKGFISKWIHLKVDNIIPLEW